MPDKYDAAIAYLNKHPGSIYNAWNDCMTHPAGKLFRPVSPTGDYCYGGKSCGCLTQVRSGESEACNPELTKAIRKDNRLPVSPCDVTLESLPVFAEWQRRMDKELGRV